jgi:hypothetical protein
MNYVTDLRGIYNVYLIHIDYNTNAAIRPAAPITIFASAAFTVAAAPVEAVELALVVAVAPDLELPLVGVTKPVEPLEDADAVVSLLVDVPVVFADAEAEAESVEDEPETAPFAVEYLKLPLLALETAKPTFCTPHGVLT